MAPNLQIWLNHFEYHAQHPRHIPVGLSDVLRPEEKHCIARSIATFQLGEQSEGHTLMRAAQQFAATHQSDAIVRLVELLIGEERRHAEILREFMTHHALELKQRDWTDSIFRRLRRLAGLEFSLYVLMSAELLGIVYYRALERATGCQRLKVICRTFVADELAHIGFESHLLMSLRASRNPFARLLTRLVHRSFYTVAAGVVWATHRRVFRQAGHTLWSYLRVCRTEYAFYLEAPPAKITSPSLS